MRTNSTYSYLSEPYDVRMQKARERWDRLRAQERVREEREVQQRTRQAYRKIGDPRPAPALEFDDEIAVSSAVDDLVKGILHPGDIAALYGPSGIGKTFVATDLAYHVALGIEWAGRQVRKAPVLYVGLEGVRGLRHRMMACRERLGSAGRMLARLTVHTQLDRSETGAVGQAKIIEQSGLLGKAAGIPTGLIIDTAARAMTGDDENSSQDMGAFVGRVSAIAEETGAAVLIVHHPGKDDARGMRGSYCLFSACDVVLKIAERDDSRLVAAEKVKDGPVGDLFAYRLERVTLGTDDDGEAITSCIVAGCDLPAGPTRKRGRPKGSARQQLGVRALKMALDELGHSPHGSSHMPQGAGARVVTFDQWRVYAANLGLTDAAQQVKRQNEALRRVLNAMVAENQAGQWKEFRVFWKEVWVDCRP
jgi:AAA domain